MKKRHLFWIIPSSLAGIFLVIFIFGHLISPVKTKRVPKKSKEKARLTEKEVKEDLDYLKYYFENVYAAYDKMKADGFDIDAVVNEIYEKTEKEMSGLKSIDESTFRNNMTSCVNRHFNNVDLHFAINGRSPYDYRTLYFSDIYVKPETKNGKTRYFVVKNERENIPETLLKNVKLLPPADIKPGQEYTGPVENLYEFYDKNELIYRYCVLTTKRIPQAAISIDGETLFVPVLASFYISTNQQFQGFRETENTLYVSMSDFVFNIGDNEYEELGKREFQELCDNVREKSRGKNNIILDLRNNGGGSPIYRNAVFANLMYNNSQISEDTIQVISSVGMDNEEMLFSPPVGTFYRRGFIWDIKRFFKELKYKKNSRSYDFEVWRKYEDKIFDGPVRFFGFTSFFYPQRKFFVNKKYVSNRDLPVPDFKGDIYILTNRYSASCSEYSLALAYIFDKMDGVSVHHVGENTCGAVSFVNPRYVPFPNVSGGMYIPTAWNKSKDFEHPKYKGEGYGWYPDYWTNSLNLVNTLCNLIDDPDLEKVLVGLERQHL